MATGKATKNKMKTKLQQNNKKIFPLPLTGAALFLRRKEEEKEGNLRMSPPH